MKFNTIYVLLENDGLRERVRKEHVNKGVILISLLILLSACATNPFRPRAGQFLSDQEWQEEKTLYTYVPGKVEVEADLHEKEISRSALRNLTLLLEEGNRENQIPGGKTAKADLYLSEYSYMKDFKPLKTLTLHLVVYSEQGTPLCSYYRSMETKESFFSSPYLYKQLEKGVRKLF